MYKRARGLKLNKKGKITNWRAMQKSGKLKRKWPNTFGPASDVRKIDPKTYMEGKRG